MFRGARRALHFAGVNLIAFLRGIAGYFGTPPMQELTGTTALFDNVALALGRQLLVEDFTAGLWEIGANTTIDDADSFTSTSAGGVKADDPSIAVGKTYTARIKGTSTSTSLSIRDFAQSTNYQSITVVGGVFDEIFTFTGAGDGIFIRSNNAGTTDIDWANSYIKQTGILESEKYPGSELLSDGDMEAVGTAAWGSADATLSKDTTIVHSGSQSLKAVATGVAARTRQQLSGALGQRIKLRAWTYNPTGNTLTPQLRLGTSSSGSELGSIPFPTTKDTWVYAELEVVSTVDAPWANVSGIASGETMYIDDMSAKTANPLNGTYSGVSLAQPGAGNIPYMVSFDALASYLTILSAELNSAFNPDAFTFMVPAIVDGAGVWTDGIIRYLGRFSTTNEFTYIRKFSLDNHLQFVYHAGGVTSSVLYDIPTPPLGLFIPAITVDVNAGATGEMKAYIDGVQVGATQTGLGTWAENLTNATIGASNTVPVNVWHGKLAYPPLARSAWDANTLAQVTAAFGV